MPPVTTLDLDPILTSDDVDRAHDAKPSDFAEVLAAQDAAGQDDLDELGAGAPGMVIPMTPPQALANAQGLSISDRFVGVGYCLRTVRQDEFRIPGLYPDAETAWDEADLKHRTGDPKAIPQGAVPFWTNGRFGHVALSAGGGMCWSTDYRRPGFVDLAPIASLASWCGGELVGWAEDVNGIDLWPDTPGTSHLFTINDRIGIVRAALHRAKERGAPARRIAGLERWLEQLRHRRDEMTKS